MSGLHVSRPPSLDLPFSASGILVIQGCSTDLIGAAPPVDSSLTGLILEIKMKSDELTGALRSFIFKLAVLDNRDENLPKFW